jgi:hypothetical protein
MSSKEPREAAQSGYHVPVVWWGLPAEQQSLRVVAGLVLYNQWLGAVCCPETSGCAYCNHCGHDGMTLLVPALCTVHGAPSSTPLPTMSLMVYRCRTR